MLRWKHSAAICLMLAASAATAEAATLLVPQQYSTISAAVAAAHNGDTIKISPNTAGDGTYHEAVTINQNTLTIMGLNGATMDGTGLADVNGFGPSGIVVYGNGVNISGLTVQDYDFFPTTYGIQLFGSSDVVSSCTLRTNGIGLDIEGSNGSASGNTASSNRVFGALVTGSSNLFANNSVCFNGTTAFAGDGGVLIFNGGNTIRDNNVSSNNGEGIHAGTGTSEFGGAAVTTGYITGNTVSGNLSDGIVLNECENQIVKNNIVSGNVAGISLQDFTRRCTLNRNTVTGNSGSGILLEDGSQIHECTVSLNTASSNGYDGIETGSDPYNGSGTLSPNTFKGNTALGNAHVDLEDHSYNGTSVLNVWNNNTFGTATPGIS